MVEKMDVDIADDDQKQFIQAFAGPTEAYRFFEEHRKRNPPLFLQRNLTYVIQKKCRSKKPRRRSSGKFNTLHSIVDKLGEQKRGARHYMTLNFSGFRCDELANYRHAEVQVVHKQTKTKLASVIIDINPNDMLKGLSTISLPTEALKITTPDGELLEITTCVLLFKVRVIDKVAQTGYVNRDDENYVFESELELFDKSRNGLIASGQHELTFAYESNAGLMSLPKQAMWKIKHFVKKSLSMNAIDDDGGDFLKPAKMTCNLQWSREISFNNENKENGEMVNGSNGNGSGIGGGKRRVFTRSRSTGSIISRRFSTYRSNDNIQCLVYQFIHKNYRQKTELWDRLKCPWCSLKTSNMYILLKHLTLCHGRFKFKYVPSTSEIRIDVFVDKREESKIDPFSRLATTFRGNEPHKRKVMTAILVNRPERQRPRLAEFLNFDTNLRRTFYHSFSGLPVKQCEIDVDSEAETDPIWLRQNTVKMINDFLDVNDGEKTIMKLWNLFVMKKAYVSDSQMPAAVVAFIKTHGQSIIADNLYRNFIIHLSNLFDYGLISAKDHYRAVRALHAILIQNTMLCNILKQRTDQQRDHFRSLRLANVGKTPSKRKRTVFHMESAIKRRLRSQSRGEPIIQKKIKRTETINNTTNSSPRPVRKLARITR